MEGGKSDNVVNYADRAAEEDVIQVGSIVPGVVDITTENSVIVYVNGKKHLKGTIRTEHLADHQGILVFLISVTF